MKKLLTLVLLVLSHTLMAQTKQYKNIILVQNEGEEIDTSSDYYIHRIDSAQFVHLLKSEPKLIIQFWQPWCGGVKDWIARLKTMEQYATQKGYVFCFISDARFTDHYYYRNKDSVGIVNSYFNKYQIDFKTYVISEGKEIVDYLDLIQSFTHQKLSHNNFCFILDNAKVVYEGMSYYFYKRLLKQHKF